MAFDAGAVIGRLDMNIVGWKTAVETVKKDQQSLSGLVMRHSQEIKNLGKTFTVAGGVMVASLGAMVKKTADYGDELNDLSKRTGVSVETLSGLKLAADKSGSSLDGLATGLRGLANAMQGATSGNKDLEAEFKALGVDVTNADGTLRSMNDVMFDVADRFAAMEDGATKTALAQDLFGKSGMALIPMLNLGSAGLKKEWEQAEKLGLVMSQDAATACDEFNDSLADLKGGLQGIGIQIGQALIPAVKGAVDGFTGFLTMVKDLTAAHPELVRVLGTGALAFGSVALAVGPLIMALPKLVQGFTLFKAMLGTTTIGVTAFAGTLTATVGVLIYYISKLTELSAAETRLQTATQTLHETENQLIEKLSEAAVAAGWQYGRMSDLIRAYDGNIAALAMAIKTGKEGVDIQQALADVGQKHAEAIDEQKKKMEETDPVTRKLQEALAALKNKAEEITETWAPMARGATFVRDVLQGFTGELVNSFIPTARDMSLVMAAAPGAFNEAGDAAAGLDLVFKAIGDSLGASAATVKIAMWNMQTDILAAYGIIVAKLPEIGPKVVGTTKSLMSEVSTVVSDAMRNIASAIAGVFNFKELFGATSETPKFDSSYYDEMIKVATSAYDKVKSEIESSVDALKAATDKEIDLIKAKYDAMADMARKEFDASELLRSRAEEDADTRLERHFTEQDRIYEARYEREKRAIENSMMTEHQKQVALRELEKTFEAEKRAREIAREDAKVARERRREDAKLRREERQERKLEAIRRTGYLAEQALRDAAQIKEQTFLTNLLNLQNQHQLDLDAIRVKEDLARQTQADDEEKRQNSLWTKVKGIFATVIEEMATIWLTRLIEKILPSFDDIGTKTKDILGEKGLGKTVGDLAGGLLSSLGSIGSIVSGITGVIDLLKGPEKQTDVTYWLKLQWELLQNSYNFYVGELTWKLNSIRDDLALAMKPALWVISGAVDNAIKPTLWSINEKAKTANGYLKTSRDYLKTIATTIGKMTSAASGAISTQTELMMVHGTRTDPEYIMRASQLNAGMFSRAGVGGQGSINLTIPFYLDGKKLDERMLRIADGRVEWLHSQYKHSNRLIPVRTIGGAG